MSVFSTISPDDWVASNALAFAIRDRFPVSPGHTLVITRRVIETWWDATADEQRAVLELINEVKHQLDTELGPHGYNVGFNAGRAAGQTVPHLHVHVMPRYDGDLPDPRGGVRHVIPTRGNYLDAGHRSPTGNGTAPTLVTSTDGHLKLELLRCLIRDDLDRIDLLVSFVKRSGIDLIARHVDAALARGARIRLLTTDYLFITDAGALGFFLDRLSDTEPSNTSGTLEARVFSDPSTSFHPKAYIFTSSRGTPGVGFVGSSNLSRSGIETGVEWNVRTFGTSQLLDEFETLWTDPRSTVLDGDWLTTYAAAQRARHELGSAVTATTNGDDIGDQIGDDDPEPPLTPWSVQAEALAALEATRVEGHQAGLVVMATGLGKTWLAAFDSTRPAFRRVLFVAHREEILVQSRDVYRRLRPDGHLTLFVGGDHDASGNVVFASIQSLHKHLDRFEATTFDYIVIDEFHHAAAATYRRIIAHFQPRFLLGLTATPNRADEADLLALCSDNLVYECDLVEGVVQGLLSPFHYRAIADVVDYEHIPWRNGRFDLEELTSHVATKERAQQVLDEWERTGGTTRRTIGFCCTIAHADFMADFFRSHGVEAVAVHSGPTSAEREVSLEQLGSGHLPIVFAVDLFNEGVDVPTIDLVLMLRPTESSVVFLQQLGRGLRRSVGKDRLDVIDLVGNHRSFLLKARILARLAGSDSLTDREAVALIAERSGDLDETNDLPPGCSIIVEPTVVDLLNNLLGPVREEDRLVEIIREWVDEHGGKRPTALQASLLTNSALELKQAGGWFGFLDRLGLLSDEERLVHESWSTYHHWIEHGSYSKSYKLVTMLAMLQLDALRSGAPEREIAATSRWMIFRDTDLLTDLADVTSAFANVMSPTADEWLRYWRRNPIAAMTTAPRGVEPWFVVDDGHIRFAGNVEHRLGSVFDDMTRELAEYRLHRYLVGRSALRRGERRKPTVGGIDVDATFQVESTGLVASSVVIESSSGTRGSPSARNVDYLRGFDLVLERLAALGVQLLDAYLDPKSTTSLTIADRRLDTGGLDLPIDLATVAKLQALRRAMTSSMAKIRQKPGAKGGGNPRKRTRLVIATPSPWTAGVLADLLATGNTSTGADAAGGLGSPINSA